MKYISTRGRIEPCEFLDAVMMGLADDGGLVIPEAIPDVRDRLAAWRGLSYAELAVEVISLFATDVPREDLRLLVERAYEPANWPGGVAPTVAVGDLHVLELWHGPTLAFKDVALQLLGNLFEYVLARRPGERLNILGATSGDTGSAAISGVRGRRGINIFMMHPRGRTSPIQARQMTSVLDANVHNIAVEGDFDDCQRIMKELAGDLDFKRRHRLGAVNSVNWARVLAQIVYYFKSAFDVLAQRGTGVPPVSGRGMGVPPMRLEGVSPSQTLDNSRDSSSGTTATGGTPVGHMGETPMPRWVSLLELWPLTGRTHQLRVHLASIGCPILADPFYGAGVADHDIIPRLALHARRLTLTHPATGEPLTIESPRPQTFEDAMAKLG